MFLYALKEFELRFGAYEVVLRILDFVVCVAVDVVSEEADGLHVGEQSGGIGQVFDFDGEQEVLGGREVALGECLEDVHVELNVVEVLVIFQTGVRAGTHEVAEVAENERGHYGVKVNDAENSLAVLIKHHVVDLGVAVADALGQFAFAVEAFGFTHFVGALFQFIEQGLHFLDATYGVSSNGFAKLTQAQFHVVEIRNGLHEGLGDVNEHALEATEGATGVKAALGGNGFEGNAAGNEHHDAPVAFAIEIVSLVALFERNEGQDLAVNVGFAGGFEFAAYVAGHSLDVVLQSVNVGKDMMVDALKNVVGGIAFGADNVSIVNQTVAKGLDCAYCAFYIELVNDFLEFFLIFHDLVYVFYG